MIRTRDSQPGSDSDEGQIAGEASGSTAIIASTSGDLMAKINV